MSGKREYHALCLLFAFDLGGSVSACSSRDSILARSSVKDDHVGAGGMDGGTDGSSTGGVENTGDAAIGMDGARNDAGSSGNIFVNPTTGRDTNSGLSSSEALKTISRAAELAAAMPGTETILLEDGPYDPSTQPKLDVTFPAGTIVSAASTIGVTIVGPGVTNAFMFVDGGGIRDVTFDTFDKGVRATGTGAFIMTGVHFRNVYWPLRVGDSVVATVDASGSVPFATRPDNGFGEWCIKVEGAATMNFHGGEFRNIQDGGWTIFHASGHAKLAIDRTVFDTTAPRAITIYENADVVLTNSQIHHVAMDYELLMDLNAAIVMGVAGAEDPLDPTLEIRNSEITFNENASGIALDMYPLAASKPVIEITDSHIDDNGRDGLFVPNITVPKDQVVTVRVANSTFSGNQRNGITTGIGAVSIARGEVSRNSLNGIEITDSTHVNSLKVRGPVKFDSNFNHGISFAGAAGSSLDLGKTTDPGRITFTIVQANYSAVNLQSALQGFAVGNTWVLNAQGANDAGAYTTPTTIMGPVSDLNATVVSGGSLVVAE
jgi:hypothetical protein